MKWFCKFLWLNLPEIIEENGAHPLLEIPYINVWPSQGKFKLLIQYKQVNTKAITPDGCSVFFTRKKQCNIIYRVVSQSAPLTSLATDHLTRTLWFIWTISRKPKFNECTHWISKCSIHMETSNTLPGVMHTLIYLHVSFVLFLCYMLAHSFSLLKEETFIQKYPNASKRNLVNTEKKI